MLVACATERLEEGFRIGVSFDPYAPHHRSGFDISPNRRASVSRSLVNKTVFSLVLNFICNAYKTADGLS
jgi:hypothetical protein